ncbi:MAG TPA: LemA family protein [Steroidobacteraceae bacterium]|nr:LemA family protein [Steroidobacteraceae bacterium]
MIVVTLLFLALLVVAAVYVVRVYNGLVALRENVRKAWANIDVLLTQRHDELPKLVDTCKRYMRYEQETLERVMQARSAVYAAQGRGDVPALGAAEDQLRQGLGRLFAVAENYPELKADQGFRHLETRISQLEEAIADRRELYNESVNLNNIRVQTFPDVIVARMFDFKQSSLLEFSEEQKRDVNVGALFG